MICPACGGKIGGDPNPERINDQKNHTSLHEGPKFPAEKSKYMIGAAVAAVLILLACFAMAEGRCRSKSCNNKKAPGSDYCYNHKCDVSGCRKERLTYSNYCYEHHLIYDEKESESSGPYSWEMNISDITVYSAYSFTYAEGTLTNNSDSTVTFVKLKGAFKNRYGSVIDTDWTYAVGSEGLGPGESCKWKMSVSKDLNIKECEVTILD